ncbi:MAG: hypothetical protein CMJ05_10245 [Pelagibacterales bacterium]|nr:hypothetical protein [Pelagibacterales bacterium]
MRLIILTTLFFIPLIVLASFPVKKTTLSDTTIIIKKDKIENYKIGFQKHNYNQQKNNYKSLFKILDSFFLVLGIISIIIATQVANNSTQFLAGLGWLYVGILSLGLSILIFLFKEIRNLFKKKQKIN